MFESDKRSPLDRVKKNLYSRNSDTSEVARHEIHGRDMRDVPTDWADAPQSQNVSVDPEFSAASDMSGAVNVMPKQKNGPKKIYKMVFWICAAFFIIACAIAAFTVFRGANFISVDNIDISVEGPASIAGGEASTFTVSVTNRNADEIQLVDLVAEFPDGTKDPSDPSKDLSRARISLGNIAPGQVIQKPVSAVLYGQEGDKKEITFSVEYRTANSNAIFYKDKPYQLTISSSPVLVSISTLDKVVSGQPTDVSVTVSSNSPTPLKGLLLEVQYPFGFQMIPGDIKPVSGDNVWSIGDLAPGAKRTISFKAVIQGEDGEDRVMHANVGVAGGDSGYQIGTLIVSRDHQFAVERPSLGIDLTFNGNRGDLVSQPGESVRAEIVWTNNSSTRIDNARIEARLSGNAIDRNSISVSDGYYNSSNDTIVWEAGRVSGLTAIAPGETNRVSFSFSSLRSDPDKPISNPTISVSVSAQGSRTDETGVSRDIATAVSGTVKLVSSIGVTARALHSQGVFSNTGPIPPKVDQETTYTLVWTVSNSSNSVSNVQVSGVLPQNVRWIGATNPSDANISYNSVGGQVTWIVGDLQPNSAARQVSFQIGLTPSLTQSGSAADLLGQTQISATDAFANATVQASAPSLTTRTTTDLYWKPGDETVTE